MNDNYTHEYLKKLYNESLSYFEKREYDKALIKINEVLKANKKNIPARSLKASILSESWNGSKETKKTIYEALDHFKKLIKEDPKNKQIYLYNMGNTFYTMVITGLKESSDKLNQEIINDLIKAKDCFEESLKINENQPDIWINKGITLKKLGRYLEALECYDRAILLNNKHCNAWGNRGRTCLRLSKLMEHEGDRDKLFLDSMIYQAIELRMYPDYEIENIDKEFVKDFVNKNKIQIDFEKLLKEQMPKKKRILGNNSFNLFSEQTMDFKSFYYDLCEKHNLFLNVHFDCNNCGYSTLDLIKVKFMVSINDSKKPYDLFKKWFTLVDDYKTSRFLLVLSQFRHKDFIFLDKQRYEPDYSLNYLLNVELLKNSFLTAMNIYDKVAFFLNEYMELGFDDEDISFLASNSIFNKYKDILEKNDWSIDLVALDSIRQDLEKKEFKKLAEIRNYIVHRYFVLHSIVDVEKLTYPYDISETETPLEHKDYHMDINEFFNLTIKALRNIRNALFSLTFFISQKEKSKEKEFSGEIGEINWVPDWEKDGEITKLVDEFSEELKESYNQMEKQISKLLRDDTTYEK